MHFTSHEKEIIKKIASGEIKDISSYLKVFNLTTFRQLNKDKIEKRLKLEENGKTYKCLKSDQSNAMFRTVNTVNSSGMPVSKVEIMPVSHKDEDYVNITASLSFDESTYTVDLGDDSSRYTYDYFQGINITNSFSDIKTFLTIWQFLKSEGLVLEVDKEVSKENYEPFFEYKPIEETSYGRNRQKCSVSLEQSDYILTKIKEFKIDSIFQRIPRDSIKDYREYIDYNFEYNKANELICSQFINKQIYGNPELDTFIRKRFRTKEQRNYMHALIPAYLSIFVSVGIALWPQNNDDITRIQKQLNEIQSVLDNEKIPDLSKIEKELQIIIDNTALISEIDKNIDESIKDIVENEIVTK